MLQLGVLDQTPIIPGATAVEAMRQTIELAKLADSLGFSRYWVSEHHDTLSLAGSSPEVLIAAIAAHTSNIRVGSGGVLLPHYSPYKVAENFRVLEALYPGRIDLGIGRAPGGMPLASRALRYGRPTNYEDRFEEALGDLAYYLQYMPDSGNRHMGLMATPLVSTKPEIWLLGSSDYSARRASGLGAAFSFAHFINGAGGQEAVRRYYADFEPGPYGDEPRANACVFVICADTDEEAEYLAGPTDLRLLLFEKGDFNRQFPTSEEAASYSFEDWERERVRENRKRMIVGGPEKVKAELLEFSRSYGVTEVLATTITADFASRKRSYELLARMFSA